MATHLSSNSGSACQVVVSIRVDWAGNPSWAPDNIPVKSSQTLPFLLIFQASGKFLYHFRFPFETIFFQTFKKRYILSMLSK